MIYKVETAYYINPISAHMYVCMYVCILYKINFTIELPHQPFSGQLLFILHFVSFIQLSP